MLGNWQNNKAACKNYANNCPLKRKVTQTQRTKDISAGTLLDANSRSVNVTYKKFAEINQLYTTFRSTERTKVNNINW